MLNEFGGELRYIDPKFLITKGAPTRVEGFFLGLGAVFNDLKGLLLFEKLLTENYRVPAEGEISSHAGNYQGMVVQLQKLMASMISEFFVFLNAHSKVFSDVEFKEILNRLSQFDRRFWNGIVAASRGELPNAEDLLKAIVHVRSNTAYHYDNSGKVLPRAFQSLFFGEGEGAYSKQAYYSLGDTINLTRFYFSDAAVEESLHLAAGKKIGQNSLGDNNLARYREQIRQTILAMSATILALMKNYIQSRRNKPH